MNQGKPQAAQVNGRASSEPWLLDRGLHFGDGLFETLSCRTGRPRFLNLHLERLMDGCRRLQLQPVDIGAVRAEILQIAAGTDSAIVKLIVTRGEALARGYGFTGNERPTRIVLRYPSPDIDLSRGMKVGIAAMRLGENPALAGMKHLNRLEQVLLRQERAASGLDELIVLSRSGSVISGTMSNVFMVRQDELLTPAVDLCGVAGIMRRVVLREARRVGIRCAERALGAGDLDGVDEIFLSSSRLGVVPVTGIAERALAIGPVTRRVEALVAPMLENPTDD